MNWILDTYSNVYTTAMMWDQKSSDYAAPAKETVRVTRSTIFRFFGRR